MTIGTNEMATCSLALTKESSKAKLSLSLAETLASEGIDRAADLAEVGLDCILNDEILRDIPILSSLVSVYRIGSSIRDRHLFRQFAEFLDEFNKDSTDRNVRSKYADRFRVENHERDLEYLMVLIDRYTDREKPRYLARLYCSYLDGMVTWDELVVFAGVIDRFLPGDFEVLATAQTYATQKSIGTEAILRLIGLGLVIEEIKRSNIEDDGAGTVIIDSPEYMAKEERNYKRTQFGNKFVALIGRPVQTLLYRE